jgi:polyisoprenoid-binding protein YceI
MKQFLYTSALLLSTLSTNIANAETWNVDSSHSEVGFEVTHMMISTVEGSFGEFSGNIEVNKKGKLTALNGEVGIVSVDTNDAKRDGHLQSDDFFNAVSFPKMTFVSKKVKGSHEKGYSVEGDLTIRDITKTVTLELTPFKGPVVDGWGNTRVGSIATAEINRQDFGVSWSSTLDAGGLVVSDEVQLDIKLEFVQAKIAK